MTITATPNLDTGHVHVTVTPPSSDHTLTRLTRIDRNGRFTQTGHDLIAWPPTMREAFNDPLCAMTGPIEYVVQWTAGDNTVTYESTTTALDLPDPLPRLYRLAWQERAAEAAALGLPMRPAFTEYRAILDHGDADEDVARIHTRGAGPHVVSIPGQVVTRTGSLTFWADTWADAAGIRDELTRHPVQHLRVPDAAGMDHALIVRTLAIDADGEAWTVTAEYTDPRQPIRLAVYGVLAAAQPYRELGDFPDRTLEDVAEASANFADMW